VKKDLTILIVGTADTKADEMLFMRQCIEEQGAQAIIMDVGVIGEPTFPPELSKHDVAAAAGMNIQKIIDLGDENHAMTKMAEGAVNLALSLYRSGKIHGILALGGTMGTDLALDVTAALPLGMPKFIVTTVAYSHLIPPERLAPDLMMILWAGGLYGLNSICRSILSQAAGAVLGACSTVVPVDAKRPKVAVISLGKSCLSYMVRLTPMLEARGFEPVVFHATGMGGRAMESLIEQGEFAAVFDFALQEVANHARGSVVSAGDQRLEAAGKMGIPQLVAPGASDLIDVQSWKTLPSEYSERPYHAHNRLIGSYLTSAEERRSIARVVAEKLGQSKGPTAFFLPLQGIQAWDRVGQPLHDPESHAAYVDEYRTVIKTPVELIELDMHINDDGFVDAAISKFDEWVESGLISKSVK
jgi:uncharacterized protein (UPF0261 family)